MTCRAGKITLQASVGLTEKWFTNFPTKKRNTWEHGINGFICYHPWHPELLSNGYYLDMEGIITQVLQLWESL